MHLYPKALHIWAKPIPVFPAVPSTIVPPDFKPFFSASFIRYKAALSLTDPPALANSHLAKISQPEFF